MDMTEVGAPDVAPLGVEGDRGVLATPGNALDGVQRVEKLKEALRVAPPSNWGGSALGGQRGPVVLVPQRIPVDCLMRAELDYQVPSLVLLSILKVESRGHPVVAVNANGSYDYGVAGINSNSWARYFQRNYGITPSDLMNPCQGIRAQAYVLRTEWGHRSCRSLDVWCAVARYHHPSRKDLQEIYLGRVRKAMRSILQTGRFE